MQNSNAPFDAVRTSTRDSDEFTATSNLIRGLSFKSLPYVIKNHAPDEKIRLITQFLGNGKTENITCKDFAEMVTRLKITDEDKKMKLITEFLGSDKAEKNITCKNFAEMVTSIGITDEDKKIQMLYKFLGSDKVQISSLQDDDFIKSLKISNETTKHILQLAKEASTFTKEKEEVIPFATDKLEFFCDVINYLKNLIDNEGVRANLIDNEGVRANLVKNYIESSTVEITIGELEKLKTKCSITDPKYIQRIDKAFSEERDQTQTQAQSRTQQAVTTRLGAREAYLAPINPRDTHKEAQPATSQQQESPNSGSKFEEPKRVEEDKIKDTGDKAEKTVTCKDFSEMVTRLGISDEDKKIQMITEFLGSDNTEKNITCKNFAEMVTRLGISDQDKKMKLITEFLGSDKVQISSLKEDNFIESLKIKEDSAIAYLESLKEICKKTDVGDFIKDYDKYKGIPLLQENEGVRANLIENLFKNSPEMITGSKVLIKTFSINEPKYIERIDKAWEDLRSKVKGQTPPASLQQAGGAPAFTSARTPATK